MADRAALLIWSIGLQIRAWLRSSGTTSGMRPRAHRAARPLRPLLLSREGRSVLGVALVLLAGAMWKKACVSDGDVLRHAGSKFTVRASSCAQPSARTVNLLPARLSLSCVWTSALHPARRTPRPRSAERGALGDGSRGSYSTLRTYFVIMVRDTRGCFSIGSPCPSRFSVQEDRARPPARCARGAGGVLRTGIRVGLCAGVASDASVLAQRLKFNARKKLNYSTIVKPSLPRRPINPPRHRRPQSAVCRAGHVICGLTQF